MKASIFLLGFVLPIIGLHGMAVAALRSNVEVGDGNLFVISGIYIAAGAIYCLRPIRLN